MEEMTLNNINNTQTNTKQFDINSAIEIQDNTNTINFDLNSAVEIQEDLISVFNANTGHIVNTTYTDPHKINYNDLIQSGLKTKKDFVAMEDISEVEIDGKYNNKIFNNPLISSILDFSRGATSNLLSFLYNTSRALTHKTLEKTFFNPLHKESGYNFLDLLDSSTIKLKQDTQRFLQSVGLNKTDKDSILFDLGSGAMSVGTSIMLKNPIVVSLLYYLQQQQNLFEEAKDNGKTRQQAKTVSHITSLLSGAVEYLGNVSLLKALKTNKVLTATIDGFLSEGIEEGTQELIEGVSMKYFGGRQETINNILKNSTYSALIGGIVGAGGGAIGQILNTTQQELENNGLTKEQAETETNKVKDLLNNKHIQEEIINIIDRENDITTYPTIEEVQQLAEQNKDMILQDISKYEEVVEKEEMQFYYETLKTDLLSSGYTEQQANDSINILDRLITAGALTYGDKPMSRIRFFDNIYKKLKLEYKPNKKTLRYTSDIVNYINKYENRYDGEYKFSKDELLNLYNNYKEVDKKIKQQKHKPLSLTQFLIKNGGIYDEDKNLKNRDIKQKTVGLFRKQRYDANGGDSSIDSQFKRVVEAGYFPEIQDYRDVDGVNLLLEAIDNEYNGGKTRYSQYDDLSLYEERERLGQGIDDAGISFDSLELLAQVEEEKSNENIPFQIRELAQQNEELDRIHKEYTQETININGVEKSVYNSNGERIAKSKEALENFYRWFGDSKVVDKNGRPLVVYHGSPQTQIEIFEDGHVNYNIMKMPDARKGFYFTNNDYVANSYATDIQKRIKDNQAKDGKIYNVYLKIENPLIINYKNEIYDWEKNLKAINKSEKNNNDGIIFKNIRDAIDIEDRIPTSNSYIVFNSNQIKSVENKGTFDLNNNNIYYQAVNKELDLEQEVNVLDITNSFKGKITKEKIKQKIQELIDKKEPIKTLTEPYMIELLNKKKNHIIYGSKNNKLNKTQYKQRNNQLLNIDSLINNSILIEKVENTKKDKKPDVDNYYYFYTPIKDNDNIYIVKLFAEQGKNNKDNVIDLYDVLIVKELKTRHEGTKSNFKNQGFNSSILTIKQILSNVKDFYGNNALESYLKENNDILNQTINGQYNRLTNTITLFETADASTFIHEIMHWWEDVVREYANIGSKQAIEDLSIINKYVGSEDGNWTMEQHEKLARSFEAYLRQGIAPSKQLKGVFERFKEWLVNIYKSIKELGVNLNQDIINYFDRLMIGNSSINNNGNLDEEINKLQNEIEEETNILYQKGLNEEEVNKKINNKFGERLKRIEEELKKSQTQIKEEEYIKNREAMELKNREERRINKKVRNKNLLSWVKDSFINTDQQIKEISEDLFYKLRHFEGSFYLISNKRLNIVNNFISKFNDIKKVNKEEYADLDFALKNGDMNKTQDLLEKYNMYEEYIKVRELLDEIREEAINVGVDVGYIENYFPRELDPRLKEDFLELMRKKDNTVYNELNYNIEQLQKEGRLPNKELYEVDFINSYLRGYIPRNLLPLSPNGNLRKNRRIEVLKGNYNYFYKSSVDALIDYVNNSTKTIEQRKFLGQDNKEVKDLRRKYKLKTNQLNKIKEAQASKIKQNELIRLNTKRAVFETQLKKIDFKLSKTTNKEVKEDLENLKIKFENNLTYINNSIKFYENIKPELVKDLRIKEIHNKLKELSDNIEEYDTNLEDSIGKLINNISKDLNTEQQNRLKKLIQLVLNPDKTRYVNNLNSTLSMLSAINSITNSLKQLQELTLSAYKNGVFNTVKAVLNKKEITVEKLGVNSLEDIINTNNGLDRFTKWLIKYIGFNKLDVFSKNVDLNASLLKIKEDIKNNNKLIDTELKLMFNNKANQLKSDILSNNITDDVLIYSFMKLAELQPITMSSRSPLFLENNSIRWMYILKQFILKQLNLLKNDVWNEVRNGDVKKGVNNLIKYQMFTGTMVGLSEYGIQELLSLLFGESEEDETVVEKLIDNIFVFNIISRYTFEAGKREGYGKAIFNMVMPASLSILSSVGFDIWKTIKTKELSVDNSLKHIPFGKDVKKMMEVGERG